MKKLNVTVNGTVYEVTLESATSGSASPAPAANPAPTTSGGGDTVHSPLAGSIVKIEVSVGQSVTEGERLFTMEAMKMNTYVTAEKAGKVTAILVKEGDQVGEGQPLLELA